MWRGAVFEYVFPMIIGCLFGLREQHLECTSLAAYYGVNEEVNVSTIEIVIKRKYNVLKKDSFKNFPELVEILMPWSVNEIEIGAFNGVKNLSVMSLFESNIPVLKANVFQNLETRELYLWESRVHELEVGSFNGIKKIHEIWLNRNYITVVKKGVFTDKPFDIIHLNRNEISHIEPGAFSGIDTLEELDLGYNHLETFEASELGLGSSLKELTLQNNKLTTLDKTMFAGLTNLRDLNLSSNLIASIGEQTFGSNLKSLELLELGNNNLIEINPNFFYTNSIISSLFVQTNNLTYISLDVLERLPKLQKLSTIYNPWQCSCQTEFKNKLTEKNITSVCEDLEKNSTCITDTSECVFNLETSKIINKKYGVDKRQICQQDY